MSDILVADAAEGNKPPQPKQIKAIVMFQDEHYTLMRNKEQITQQDVYDMPLHMVLIACGMLDAHAYVPKIGKEAYLRTMKKLKKQFDDNYKKQKAVVNNMAGPK